jgi:hypothetical protein
MATRIAMDRTGDHCRGPDGSWSGISDPIVRPERGRNGFLPQSCRRVAPPGGRSHVRAARPSSLDTAPRSLRKAAHCGF